jgi:hypothetical protein
MYHNKKKMADGGKLKMVEKDGKRVPFYAADGKGKMMHGGRVEKMGGGRMMYGHGGHVSIRDMEKACNKMAGYQESGQRKEDK